VCALEGEAMVGTAGAFPFSLTVPGGSAPAAGVTAVGVLPTHRRRGVLTHMMRYQLGEIHDRGEPLAVLFASESSIYGRFGYGLATLQGDIDIERDRTAFHARFEPVGSTRLVDIEEAVECFPDVYDRIRVETPGMFARSPEWWRHHVLSDPPHNRRGRSPMARVVLEVGGRPEAYATYRVNGSWEQGVPTGSLEVEEALATSTEATAALWRFLFGVDLVRRVKADLLPMDHPLILMLVEPRRLRFALYDGLWLRIVEVSGALTARSYAGEGSVVFELTDSTCPWNGGRWRLDAGPEGATATKTSEDPDLALDVADLGAVYLGGFGFRDLHRAGRIAERSEGAVRRADALFATDRAPYCPEIF